MKQKSLSVPRLSRLEYVIGVIKEHGMKEKITFNDLFETIKKIGFSIEMMRIKTSGIYRDITKEERSTKYQRKMSNQTRETIRLLKRWGMIREVEKEKATYEWIKGKVNPLLTTTNQKGNIAIGLYRIAVEGGEEFIFPSKYPMLLRDGTINGTSGAMDKEVLQEKLGEVTIKRKINPVSIDVIVDWMEFFGFSSLFQERKCQGDIRNIIVSTKAVARMDEIKNLVRFIESSNDKRVNSILKNFAQKHELKEYAVRSIYNCAKHIGYVKEQNNTCLPCTKFNYSCFWDENTIIVKEENGHAKILQKEDIENICHKDYEHIYVCTDFDVSVNEFLSILIHETRRLCKTFYDYAWIHEIKKQILGYLHIPPKRFDELFTLIYRKYGPSIIETAIVQADSLGLRRIKGKSVKPIIIDGKPIYRIRVRRDYL